MPSSTASTAAPTTSNCPISTPPAIARRARSSSCASSTTRKGGGAWRLPSARTSRIEEQVTAPRRDLARPPSGRAEPAAPGQAGFGAEVRDAMERRAEQLIEQGLAERQASGITFTRDLIDTLRKREVEALGRAARGRDRPDVQSRPPPASMLPASYRQRFALASGRFAMIDDGLGFQLVPWSPSLEKQLGRHVSGVTRDDGGVDWGFGRKRGLGL